MRLTLPLLVALAAAPLAAQDLPDRYQPVADTARIPRQPFRRWFTQDSLGRRITFYLSEEPDSVALPLFVYVQGSGAASLFAQRDGRVSGNGGFPPVADIVRGKARLLLVEKPGIAYLDPEPPQGGAVGAPLAFRQEHTLERWTVAITAAVRAARSLPSIRRDRLLVAGHSEGGIVAAAVAAALPEVTHAAILAGGGPSQLFDLVTLARRGEFFSDRSEDGEVRANYVLEQWSLIQRDPDNAERYFFGHPFRRWASFMRNSTVDQLLRTDAALYIAQGAEDKAVTRGSFELLRTELLRRNRPAKFELVPGANHSFAVITGDQRWDEWPPLFKRITDWFLGAAPAPARTN